MDNYECVFNYQREKTVLTTEANSHYNAILKCLAVMAKKYGVKRQTMINYFKAEKLNHESKIIPAEKQ